MLQYVGGYVPHSLLKKYEKRSSSKYEQFITCLGNMAVLSEHDSFLDYTKEWVQRVNRGGLFPLNITTYLFFVSIEKQVRNILVPYLGKNRTSSNEQFQEIIIKTVFDDEEVQWHWLLLSNDIDTKEDANELLTDIITLWVTIRGFSICAMWMEQYKQDIKKGTRKSVSLRKKLNTYN